jgi:hypothetical protein
MKFINIPQNSYELGWRFDWPANLLESVDLKLSLEKFVSHCSHRRSVTLAEFSIAERPIVLSEFIGDPYDLDEKIEDLDSLCQHIDQILESRNLRLPTEDELEAASAGEIFIWGNEIPDGIPYDKSSSFVAHRAHNSFGLYFLSDPYKVEICRTALKFGDGGSAICGGDQWPLAWLKLSPCFRMIDNDLLDCFIETLEETYIRPVRLV